VADDRCTIQRLFDIGYDEMPKLKNMEIFFHRHSRHCLAWAPQPEETKAGFEDSLQLLEPFQKVQSFSVRFGSHVLSYIGEGKQPQVRYGEAREDYMRDWHECFLAHLADLLMAVKATCKRHREAHVILPKWRAPLWFPADVAVPKFFEVDWNVGWCEKRLEQHGVAAKVEIWNNLENEDR
jgi:hypothetical protein